MEFSVCSQCGSEIEGKGIHFRDRSFCSDECCDEFEEEFVASGEPDLDELEEDIDEDFDDDDLGYDNGDSDSDDDFLDDDFDIKPEDF
jgi:hypothetical protein